MLQVVVVALLVLLVGVFLKGVLAGSSTVSAQLRDGKRPPAPDFTLDTLDGGTAYSVTGAWTARHFFKASMVLATCMSGLSEV